MAGCRTEVPVDDSPMLTCRWIDVGLIDPVDFHSAYMGIAESQSWDGQPVVLWGRTTRHLCLGQHQSHGAELAAGQNVPVLRRPLGGGLVWLDEFQYCYVLIVPRHYAPPRPQQWFEWGLAPAVDVYDYFGLPVCQQAQDLWLSGRKIGGSGAATIGECAVLASSFLLHFPRETFAASVACPSEGFRTWLGEALGEAMTDWRSHQTPPHPDDLAAAFRRALERRMGWHLVDSGITDNEAAARETARAELAEGEDDGGGRRLIPHGVKLNAATFLTERRDEGQWVRVLTRGRRFARIALSVALPAEVLGRLAACGPSRAALIAELEAAEATRADADYWAESILAAAYFGEE